MDFTSLSFVAVESLRERSNSISCETRIHDNAQKSAQPPQVKVYTTPPSPHSSDSNLPEVETSFGSEAAWARSIQKPSSPPLNRNETSLLNASKLSGLRRGQSQYRTSTRVRKFIVDGQEISTTSTRIVLANKETSQQSNQQSLVRKRALRDFRMLAKESKWKARELMNRTDQQSKQLEAKLAAEFTQLHRQLTRDLEIAAKKFKSHRDRLTSVYENDSRALRESTLESEKNFRDEIKSKLDGSVSRAQRKVILRDLMDSANPQLLRATSLQLSTTAGSTLSAIGRDVMDFRDNQDMRLQSQLAKVKESYEKKLAHLSIQFRSEQFTINQAFTSEQWKMEQRHMQMRHQLALSHLRDFSGAQRQLLARRLSSERLELAESAQTEHDNLLSNQALERKSYMKTEKHAKKKRISDFQKSFRDMGGDARTSYKDSLLRFEEEAHQRMIKNIGLLDKHQLTRRQMLKSEFRARIAELEQQQTEKKNMLADQETARLQELNEEHRMELKVHSDRFIRKLTQLREEYERDIAGQADYLGLQEQREIVHERGDSSTVDHRPSSRTMPPSVHASGDSFQSSSPPPPFKPANSSHTMHRVRSPRTSLLKPLSSSRRSKAVSIEELGILEEMNSPTFSSSSSSISAFVSSEETPRGENPDYCKSYHF